MRFSNTLFLAAAGISTTFASPAVKARQEIGTFDTFTDKNCTEGGKGIDVTGDEGYVDFGPGIGSIDSHLPNNCALVIWKDGAFYPPYIVVGPNSTNQCIPFEYDSSRLFWNAVCN
ncbi:hypothetical protein F4821DRAFT_264966 [Hypoxylon rubiginosum]|uniref:Uncharacterized protein n=1 Tax=Hypoxylon rubiginosum TaxID=110542 RepID=A0ACC0CLX0_9PEZI|nr:hypothetical protein F4821DRAFT_264966 [Hypoxylon rubiginosum]